MRPIADPVETATVKAGFSHHKGDVAAGSPTVVAAAAVGVAAIGSAPWGMPPAPAALPVTASAPAAGTGMAMEEEEPHSTESAVACIGATPWVMQLPSNKNEEEDFEEGEIRLERKASIEVTNRWISILSYAP
ncbi:unnamed protein product, partial [Ectocarpus sp. 4 AP-2014]